VPDLEGVCNYVTFCHLGGPIVSHAQVTLEVARWPLDGILGFLGTLSLEAVQAGPTFSDPRQQGQYLNFALVDDFPRPLPRASEMYAPGRVPYTGGEHLLIHERNLAWLAHEALLGAREGAVTSWINNKIRCRLFRLLLIANDFFAATEHEPVPANLVERQTFVLAWLRHGQFNKFFEDSWSTIHKIARQRMLMLEILPKYFPEIDSSFIEATHGVSLQRYFDILLLLVAHIHHEMAVGKQWLARDTLCAAVRAHRDEIECIIRRWTRTPEEYRHASAAWNDSRPATGYRPFYDFVPLRETPLIEARPGDLICPVIPFLLAKVVDDPYFVLSDHLQKNSQRLREDFQQALGHAYEEYAHRLVERVGPVDRGGLWQVRHSPSTRKDGQLSDSYLQRGSVGVAFEHKGQRPESDFLRGGQEQRVLGPSHSVLTRLEQQEIVPLKDGKNKGLFTRGMWQQSRAGQALHDWAEHEIGTRPVRVFPVITHLADLRIDEMARMAYLNPLITQAKLYHETFWVRPQWLQVSDLEGLASLAEEGRLDLQALLQEKIARYENKRFDIFLYERFGFIPFDRKLHDAGLALLENAGASFWLEDLRQGTGEPDAGA